MRVANNRSEYLAIVLVGGVALILLVHFLRDNFNHAPAVSYLLGVAPNFIASFTFPVAFISAKKRAGWLIGPVSDGAWFLGSTLLTLAVVVAWEFRQVHLTNFVFDPGDIGASVIGAVLFLCCWPIVRRFMSAA